VVRVLLEHGADVNAQGGNYGTALQIASVMGHLEVVRVLLEHGADVNAQGGEYSNALQVASTSGCLEMVRILLEHGADVNAQGGYFGNALAAAAANGFDEGVRMLLLSGADVNLSGTAALYWAAEGGHVKVVGMLLDAGADIDSRHETPGGQLSALSAALNSRQDQVAQLLLARGARLDCSPEADLERALERGTEIVQLILERGAGVIPQQSYDRALVTAVIGSPRVQNWSEKTRLLLEAGADVNTVTSEAELCPIETAYKHRNWESLDLLLDAGADLGLVKDEGIRLLLQWRAPRRAKRKQQMLQADASASPAGPHNQFSEAGRDTEMTTD